MNEPFVVEHVDHDQYECPDPLLCARRAEYRIVTTVAAGEVTFDLGADLGRVLAVMRDYREHSSFPWRLERRIVGAWINTGADDEGSRFA